MKSTSNTSIIKIISLLIGIIGIIIGIIGQKHPILFFNIPHVGFILWAMTGNDMPPYLSEDPWLDHASWLKDNDVVVVSSIKSGSTWIQYILHQIRTYASDDADDLWIDVNIVSPHMDMIHYPGLLWKEPIEEQLQATQTESNEENQQKKKKKYARDLWNTTILSDGSLLKDHWDNKIYPFRIFKSHNRPIIDDEQQDGEEGSDDGNSKDDGSNKKNNNINDNNNKVKTTTVKIRGRSIPVKERPNVKYVVMTRNGLDIIASTIPFFDQHTDEFRNMWGGFPPKSSGNIQKDAKQRLEDFLPNGILYNEYFTWLLDWWTMKDEPNTLFIHFSDAKNNLESIIKLLADFVNIQLSHEQIQTIVQRGSIEHMKSISQTYNKFNYRLSLHPDNNNNRGNSGNDDNHDGNNNNNEIMDCMKPNSIVRKGNVGDGETIFTNEQKKIWKSAEETILGKNSLKLLQWARHGGDTN